MAFIFVCDFPHNFSRKYKGMCVVQVMPTVRPGRIQKKASYEGVLTIFALFVFEELVSMY
jgi:hypothetical protein